MASSWLTYSGLTRWGAASSRKAAMNLVDRPYRYGTYTVRNQATGETWERRRGTWVKTADGQRRRPTRKAVKPRRPAAEPGVPPLLPAQRRLL